MDQFWLHIIVPIVAANANGDHPTGSAVEVCAGGRDQKSLTSPPKGCCLGLKIKPLLPKGSLSVLHQLHNAVIIKFTGEPGRRLRQSEIATFYLVNYLINPVGITLLILIEVKKIVEQIPFCSRSNHNIRIGSRSLSGFCVQGIDDKNGSNGQHQANQGHGDIQTAQLTVITPFNEK